MKIKTRHLGMASHNNWDGYVSSVIVEQLFGLYDYILSPRPDAENNGSRLLILYGDNGSGKTTVLRLLYHLLSTEDNRGHRTFVAQVPFKRFAVAIGKHILVEAIRPDDNITGSYNLRISRSGNCIAEVFANVRDGAVRIKQDEVSVQAEWSAFMKILSSIKLSLYYLPDDRKPESANTESDDDSELLAYRTFESQIALRHRMEIGELAEKHFPVLDTAIKRTEEWIRQEALKAANTGEADTNKIYSDIVKRIARSGHSTTQTKDQSLSFTSDLIELQKRSEAYSALGFTSPLEVKDILAAVDSMRELSKLRIISEILRPYIDGISARLKALSSVQEFTHAFLDGINSFFMNKEVTFDLSKGLEICSKNGQRLPPSMLSSGEKQLLLLFCNTVTARDQASIFVIDEPEISLNVKWQRRLMRALLSLVRDRPVQFVVATHSIELLAQFNRNVVPLEDKSSAHA